MAARGREGCIGYDFRATFPVSTSEPAAGLALTVVCRRAMPYARSTVYEAVRGKGHDVTT